jgi:NAD(P)-dependent dehydrogenase (short-subunit alcohol dehydrogenase family)
MDKKLLIFGANGALGKCVTKVLMQKDYNEIILFGTKTNSEITDTKVKQVVIKDLSDEKNVAEAFINIRENPKTNFYLFSTIGGYYGGLTTWETEEIDFDRMFNMNLKANYLITKKFAEIVKGSNGGSICLTSAYTSIKPEALKFAYGASKSALNYLVKVMALEGERINLSINAIAPLIIDTPANREWMKDANYTSWVKPEEIGELINSLFDSYNFVSGNILELKSRFMK